jgi:N-acetyl-gamma-glutamyl-phosphate reductase
MATSRPATVRVAVAGATGYAGQELVAILADHPAVAHLDVFASERGGERRIPGWTGPIGTLAPREAVAADLVADTADVAFLALPEAGAACLAPRLLDRGVRVIDVSGAFRLTDGDLRTRWYPDTTDARPSVYGLTERRRAQLHDAALIACPGCYPTAALLAIEPLRDAGFLAPQSDVVIDAKSGISGAGRSASDRTHFCECHGNVSAYGVFAHRHSAEIEQELGASVTFVPHLVPLDRGLLATIFLRLRPGVQDADISAAYDAACADAPFVRVAADRLPTIKDVAYTNRCDIGWTLDAPSGRLVVVSCLDNLRKGAASQAVQNFNLALGLDERTGLR